MRFLCSGLMGAQGGGVEASAVDALRKKAVEVVKEMLAATFA